MVYGVWWLDKRIPENTRIKNKAVNAIYKRITCDWGYVLSHAYISGLSVKSNQTCCKLIHQIQRHQDEVLIAAVTKIHRFKSYVPPKAALSANKSSFFPCPPQIDNEPAFDSSKL